MQALGFCEMPAIWDSKQKQQAQEFIGPNGPIIKKICPWFERHYSSISRATWTGPRGSVENVGTPKQFINAYMNLSAEEQVSIVIRAIKWLPPCGDHLGEIMDGADEIGFIWHPRDMADHIRNGGDGFKNHSHIIEIGHSLTPEQTKKALKIWLGVGLIAAMMHLALNLEGLPFECERDIETPQLWPEQGPMLPTQGVPMQMVPVVPVELIPVQLIPAQIVSMPMQPMW
jgi:hypothetical protein